MGQLSQESDSKNEFSFLILKFHFWNLIFKFKFQEKRDFVMKYTLPRSYTNAGLQVEIPDTTLKQYRSELGSTKAAVDKWLYENGHMAKTEYEASVEKTETKKPVKREFKIDQEKAEIVSFIAKCLPQFKETMDSPAEIVNIEVTNPNRMIAFSLGNNNYEITLVRKKTKK